MIISIMTMSLSIFEPAAKTAPPIEAKRIAATAISETNIIDLKFFHKFLKNMSMNLILLLLSII